MNDHEIGRTVFMICVCIFVIWSLSSCGGNSKDDETLAAIEICLDQGGEWVDSDCKFEEKRKCHIMAKDGAICIEHAGQNQ